MNYWLLKTEPTTYSFSQLLKDGKTNWNGVRNFQARNYLRTLEKGDLCLVYHSGDIRAAVGIARVARGGYPDPDPKKPGDWVQVDLEPVQALPPVTLSTMKATAVLKTMPLIKHTRLSVMPITAIHYKMILKLAQDSEDSNEDLG